MIYFCQTFSKTKFVIGANGGIKADFSWGQSGGKCGVGSQRTCSHFFRLLAHILTIFDKKYRILTRRDKRESNLIVLQQNNV